ncbi:MAG: FecR domain-containing protein [Cytophagaceae bacterium]|nr:FecR domain-containing protein [Cytophagaceae bacterium]
MQPYEQYSFGDFLNDSYFLNSTLNPSDETERFWANWLQQHPDKHPLWQEAHRAVLALDQGQAQYQTRHLAEAQVNGLWARIQQTTAAPQPQVFNKVYRNPWRMPRRWAIAASVAAFLLLSGLGVYYWRLATPGLTEQHTAYGQTQTLQLPDGSVVTLNANSTLRYTDDWQQGTERNVSLDGEAFFEITHLKSNARFVVHTGKLDVVVLGTKFNVNTRRNLTRVTLKEGKVQLNNLSNQQSLVMNPGETVEWSALRPTLAKKAVRAERYAAWTEKRLVFENTPLPEVAQMLEDTFGLTVKIDNPGLTNKTLSGEISLENEQILLQALHDLYGIEISRQGNTIILR